jgi:hypothetical protein
MASDLKTYGDLKKIIQLLLRSALVTIQLIATKKITTS